MAILNEIEARVDDIMDILNEADCDENISIHITRNASVMYLRVNNEYYSRLRKGKWKKISEGENEHE